MKNYDLKYLDLQLFADEKTEDATPHRKHEARKKGQVAKSADLNAAIVVICMIVLVYTLKGFYINEFHKLFNYLYTEMLVRQDLNNQNLLTLSITLIIFFFKVLGPIFLAAIVVGVGINLVQVGFLFAPESIQPKLDKINPLAGFKRMFSMKAIIELLKALLKVIVVGFVAYSIVKGSIQDLLSLYDVEITRSFMILINLLFRISINALMVFFVIAIIDYVFQRFEFNKSIKMTKQEIKEEFKQMEGDPQLKSKIKEKQREMSMHRMMQSIPESTVVITNPTHLAIAIKYKPNEEDAPKVMAKGAGTIAQKIKEKAKDLDIPIVENKPLARFIYKNVEIGQEIPEELYQAVAEILAMLYKSGRRF